MHPANGTRGLRRAAFTTVCAVLAQGCSTFFVHELRSQPTDELPRCTESVAAPVADMIIAGTAFVFGGLALEAALGPQASSEKPGPILPALFGAAAVAAGASAYKGLRETSRCRQAVTSWCALRDCGEPDAPR